MSLRVIALCRSRIFRTHTMKHVIKEMADRASDDGSGIWCSKQTLANDTGLSKDGVKKAIKELLALGLIEETGKRRYRNYYTKIYRIVLEEVELLPSVVAFTGCEDHPAQGDTETATGCKNTPSLGDEVTPNLSSTVQQPPTRKCEVSEEVLETCFELAWIAYPGDRKRNRKECYKKFRSAVALGAKPEGIVQAIQTYEETTRRYTRSKVMLSDNWFRKMNWHQFIEREALDENHITEAMKLSLDRCAKWINEGSPLCSSISAIQVRALFDTCRATHHQLVRVGLDHMLEESNNG